MCKPNLSSKSQSALTLILTLALVVLGPTNAVTDMEDTKVSITNVLRSKEPVEVHCKDQKKDLGAQMLETNKSFNFTVEPEIIRTPLYRCTFKWSTEFHAFDIFDEGRDKDQCEPVCDWQVRENGPCVVMGWAERWVRCYIWSQAYNNANTNFEHIQSLTSP